jgi:regulator of protease activity HflC (stomatin/prohibitin superfamily)
MIVLLIVSIILLLVCLRYCVIIIPPRHVAIVERLGSYHERISSGIHFLIPFVDRLHVVDWSYHGQNNLPVRKTMCVIPCENIQMDVPPVACITKDHIQLATDVTLFYTIHDPKKAIYYTDDVLNLFYQCATQAIRNQFADTDSHNSNGKDGALAFAISERINVLLGEDKGIRSTQVVIQSIRYVNNTIIKETQAIHVQAKKHEMELQNLKYSLQLQEAKHHMELGLIKQTNASELAKIQAQKERDTITLASHVDKQTKKHERLLQLGFSHDQLIQMSQAEALASIASSESSRIIYMPTEMLTNLRYVNPSWNPELK